MTKGLSFACLAAPGRTALEAGMFTASLREYGGRYAGSKVRIFTPTTAPPWPEGEETLLAGYGVEFERFSVPDHVKNFPFGPKVLAAAAAEAKAKGESGSLVWMDSDSLIVSEPNGLILEPGYRIGSRPVDHTLIGSTWDSPIDPFWSHIYQDCGVSEGCIFPVEGSVDEKKLRPYFNAGFLVIRPELGVLNSWSQVFQRHFRSSVYQAFYEEHILYRIFFHQAMLAGVLLSFFENEEFFWLSPYVNYPLHMHEAYPPGKRPDCFEDLTTVRYDLFFERPGWEAVVPMGAAAKTWLKSQPRVLWGAANPLELD